MAKVPLLLVFVTQLASVLGDATGQRCSRVYHKRNRQRFLLSMVAVTCLQMLAVLLFIQVALPSTASELHKKVNGTVVDVCKLPHGDPHRPDDACYAQGPLTMYKAIGACPILLCNGLMNVLYYFGEATMYRESLGVMLIVMCALTSTFIVAPMQTWLGMGASHIPGAGAIVFGIIGALLCSIERKVEPPEPSRETTADELLSEDGDRAPADSVATPTQGESDEQPVINDEQPASSEQPAPRVGTRERVCAHLFRAFPIILPFLGLSFTYALYFCMMQMYDEKCNANPWGYNSIDQVGLPVYMYPAILVGGLFEGWRRRKSDTAAAPAPSAVVAPATALSEAEQHDSPVLPDDEDYDETFWATIKHAVREDAANYGQGFAFMFLYRLMINGRAVSYFFIATQYDLSEAYFVLTLVRVLLSWVVSLALVLLVPRYIHAEDHERAQLLDPKNLTAKAVGSVCVILSLLFINGTI